MKFIKELIPYIVIILVVVLIRTFIITPARVDGDSMNPTLKDGQILLLDKMTKNYNRMDIIVFNYKNERLIKRVIGLPGETVEIKDNKIYINNNLIEDYSDSVDTADFKLSNIGLTKIPDDCYFVLGDNRYNSMDSRMIGVIKKSDTLGKIVYRIFPFSKFGSI